MSGAPFSRDPGGDGSGSGYIALAIATLILTIIWAGLNVSGSAVP